MTIQTRDEAFEAFEATRTQWLAAARAWARQYARGRDSITINDVRRYGPAIPEGVDPRVAGAVFRDTDQWERLGYTNSKRRTSHGRPVMAFRLVT